MAFGNRVAGRAALRRGDRLDCVSIMRKFLKRLMHSPVEVPPEPTPPAPIETELTDLLVRFQFKDGTVLTRVFSDRVLYWTWPSPTLQRNCATEALQNFLKDWSQSGFAVIGDSVLRFSEFHSAKIESSTKKVTLCPGNSV